MFGVGPGRTGTDSLKLALDQLGFGPTYHMKEVLFEEAGISTAGHIPQWRALAEGRPVDLSEMLREWNSGTDFPLSSFPEELYAAFPDAKFVLTTRPTDAWLRSINKTICKFSTGRWHLDILRRLPVFPFARINEQLDMMNAVTKYKFAAESDVSSWAALCGDAAIAAQVYEAWNERVKRVIPSDQLLVFELGKTGFDELCAFLGVPVPEDPAYPRANASAELERVEMAFKVLAIAVVCSPVLVLLVLCRCLGCGLFQKSKQE